VSGERFVNSLKAVCGSHPQRNEESRTQLITEGLNSMMPSSDWDHPAPFDSSRKTVLVVEDEFLIRVFISEELRDAGFDVIEAANADEAIAAFRSFNSIDLIFSDVRMPGSLDGLELLTVVRGARPTLPVIMTSGHLEAANAIAEGAAHFVPKPYSMQAVISLIQRELEKAL
jgi:DNA-binding NtrC family response regulator